MLGVKYSSYTELMDALGSASFSPESIGRNLNSGSLGANTLEAVISKQHPDFNSAVKTGIADGTYSRSIDPLKSQEEFTWRPEYKDGEPVIGWTDPETNKTFVLEEVRLSLDQNSSGPASADIWFKARHGENTQRLRNDGLYNFLWAINRRRVTFDGSTRFELPEYADGSLTEHCCQTYLLQANVHSPDDLRFIVEGIDRIFASNEPYAKFTFKRGSGLSLKQLFAERGNKINYSIEEDGKIVFGTGYLDRQVIEVQTNNSDTVEACYSPSTNYFKVSLSMHCAFNDPAETRRKINAFRQVIDSRHSVDEDHVLYTENGMNVSYTIVLRPSTSADLEHIVGRLQELVKLGAAYSQESVLAQLYEQLHLPDETLEKVVQAIAMLQPDTDRLNPAKKRTGSIAKVDYVDKGMKMHMKLSADILGFETEHEYLSIAQHDPLMRVTHVKPRFYAADSEIAVLDTYGEENPGLVSREDESNYWNTLTGLMIKYAKGDGRELQGLIDDEHVIDTFNMAVAHTVMRQHICNPKFNRKMHVPVYDFGYLLERAKSTCLTDSFEELRGHEQIYTGNKERFEGIEPLSKTLTVIHGDRRKEQICRPAQEPDRRVVCDLTTATVGLPEYDLSKLESANNAAYVPVYAFFCNELDRMYGNEPLYTREDVKLLQARVHYLSQPSADRAASFKLMNNWLAGSLGRGIGGAADYLALSRAYAELTPTDFLIQP